MFVCMIYLGGFYFRNFVISKTCQILCQKRKKDLKLAKSTFSWPSDGILTSIEAILYGGGISFEFVGKG